MWSSLSACYDLWKMYFFTTKIHFFSTLIPHCAVICLSWGQWSWKWGGVIESRYSEHYRERWSSNPAVFIRPFFLFLTGSDQSVFIYCSDLFDVDVLDRRCLVIKRYSDTDLMWEGGKTGGWSNTEFGWKNLIFLHGEIIMINPTNTAPLTHSWDCFS